MRKLMVGAAVAAYLGTAGVAAAGSLSMKDAPVYMPPASWTGLYIGAGVGAGAVVHELDVNAYEDVYKRDCKYSFSRGNWSKECGDYYHHNSTEAGFNFDGIGGEGIFGTVQIGYDWQFAPRGVFGVFADADLSGIETDLSFSASQNDYTYLTGKGELDMDWMWTIGARLGYLTTPDTLFYVLLGYSQAKFDDPSITLNYDGYSDTFKTSLSTFKGWTIGAGMETRLDQNWGLKLEYRFTQLQDEELFSASGSDYDGGWQCAYGCAYDKNKYLVESGISADLEPSIHTGRLVLTYRFGETHAPLESLK